MQQLIEITGNVHIGHSAILTGEVLTGQSMVITGNLIIGTDKNHDKYDGDYVIVPKVYEQILNTDDKLMTDDVTVKEITYTLTSNEKGWTAQIGEV